MVIFIAEKQGSGDNKTYALISDEEFAVLLNTPVLKWARLPLQCLLLGPMEASGSPWVMGLVLM